MALVRMFSRLSCIEKKSNNRVKIVFKIVFKIRQYSSPRKGEAIVLK